MKQVLKPEGGSQYSGHNTGTWIPARPMAEPPPATAVTPASMSLGRGPHSAAKRVPQRTARAGVTHR